MGYMRHQAIIVTDYDNIRLEANRAKAVELFGPQVSNIVESKTNGYRTFFIGPDGSKEGWDTSAEGDSARDEFKAHLKSQAYEDGSGPGDWAEVTYQDDGKNIGITDHN